MDCLIVMDNVSCIADNCKEFEEFLTVCRKYIYHCVYVFHIIAPETQIWKKKLSQANILIFFLQVCHIVPLLKLFKEILDQQQKNMFLLIQHG